jgi:hypothetical protein
MNPLQSVHNPQGLLQAASFFIACRKILYIHHDLCYNILNDIPRRIYETLTSLFGCLVDALSVRV